MPPSGFSQEAVNGLLDFVKDNYQLTLKRCNGRNLTEEQILQESMNHLKEMSGKSSSIALGETVSEKGINGLRIFVSANWKDLIREIKEGKKEQGRAMQQEIEDIGDYLSKFKLEED